MDLTKWIYGGQDACSKTQWDLLFDRGLTGSAMNRNCLHLAMTAYIGKHPNETPTSFIDARCRTVEFIREVYILNRDEMGELLREHEREARESERRSFDAVFANMRREGT